MEKHTLSVTLYEDIFRRLNELAESTGADHSYLINKILAEYFSTRLPQENTREVFDYLSETFAGDGVFRVHARQSDGLIYMKSSYRHEHRPELKYTLDINGGSRKRGMLKAAFRANDVDSLARFNSFVQLWIDLERHYIHPYFAPGDIEYAYGNGRFSRTIATPRGAAPLSGEALSRAVSEYVRRLDKMLKLYLANADFTGGDLERGYREYINLGILF